MASGSAGRADSGSKGFDFASDDILCTYDDFANQDSSNGSHSDVIPSNSSKDFQKTRMARSSAYPVSSYSQPEDSLNPDMITIIERTMRKHNDNLMRYLEGISSRLSQLELHCYNLDKSIGEMRSDFGRGHGEADTKLKALEKHIQEVHRSVQILRDKQELADTQKELAKLELAHNHSSSSLHSQSEEKCSPPESNSKKPENTPETYNNQLAIVPKPSQAPSQNVPPQQPYYMPPAQLPNPPAQLLNPPAQAQHHQAQYMTPDPQYQPPQAPPPVSQAPQGQQFPQYQQQWPQQPVIQPPMRPSSPSVYPTYPPTGQPENSSPSDTAPYGYGPTRIPQQPLPKANYGAQPADGFPPAGPHSALPPSSGYMVYDSEGGRTTTHHLPPQQAHFPQGIYPPPNRNPNHSQYIRNHPYSELVEKLVSMGFRGDHVVSVIQRMEESGQLVDFNAVLDRLSGSSGGSQRGGWSG